MIFNLEDAALHFFAGTALAGLDYTGAVAATNKNKRINQKEQALKSIEILLDSNNVETEADIIEEDGKEEHVTPQEVHKINPESAAYGINVKLVKEFLDSKGFMADQKPFYKRIWNFCSDLVTKERINNMSLRGKFLFAAGAEVVYDSWLGWQYYQGSGNSPIAAFSNNLYQIPAFFTGLVVGKIGTKTVNWFVTSKQEKEMDKALDELISTTPIIDIVMDYEPNSKVSKELEAKGYGINLTRLTKAGEDAYDKLEDTAGRILNYRENKKKQAEEEKDKAIANFKNLADKYK